MVVTGTRAEFGLLEPVMHAVASHPRLELRVVIAGAHLLPPAHTAGEVRERWGDQVCAEVEMQRAGESGRIADAAATGRGIAGLAGVIERERPGWCVVLGDRVEAFAGAAAASIAGVAVAHLHGGDRAEGVADEAMRHAISKLAHLHLAATAQSGERLVRMGEPRDRVHVVGSPAVDAIASITPADDALWRACGEPGAVLLHHPVGDDDETERSRASALAESMVALRTRVLWLHPNHDAGRDGVITGMEPVARRSGWAVRAHLPRAEFVGVLKRLAATGGVMVGNSSAALIEAAVVGLPAIDVGERQRGREHAGNVVHVDSSEAGSIRRATEEASRIDRSRIAHPYGDGTTGVKCAALMAGIDPHERGFLRKCNAY
jgi:UDP-hydrolysing UDP-N-acetyl-D-glucosamine 2-epimerase